MDGLNKYALFPGMHRSKNVQQPMGEILDQDASF